MAPQRSLTLLLVLTMCVCVEGKRIWDIVLNDFTLHKMARALATQKLTGLFEADNITVFLPTSDAFFTFQANAQWYALDPENPSHLETVLLYSSVQGRYLVSDLPGQVTATLPSRLDSSLPLYVNNLDTKFGKMLTINGARLLKSDIIADNGVIHVIDRALAPVAHRSTLATYVEKPPLPQFSFMSIYLARAVVPDLTLETNRTDVFFTSFSPNDSYITTMPEYGKAPLFENWDLLRLVYEAHVVRGNALFLPDGVVPNDTEAILGTLKFSRQNGHTYVSNGYVRARVVQANVPVLNGVLHVIDNLMYYIYRDVVQMVQSLPNARKFSQLLETVGISLRNILMQHDRNYTVFVPTDTAFAKIPTTVQQQIDLEEELRRKVIMSHVITDVTLDADTLKTQSTLTTLNGNIIRVVQDAGDTYLEWGTYRSKVEVTDLGVTNGLVHLVDSVLFLNNFTVWQAMSYMPILSRMRALTFKFEDIVGILAASTSHVTVFLATDTAMEEAESELLAASSSAVEEALRGHIVLHSLGSHEIRSPMSVTTLADSTITFTQDRESGDLYVTGSHVTARVTVKNIWCSNGVIYVIDEILHLPTRTIAKELNKRPNLVYMRMLFEMLADEDMNLKDTSRDFTLFVADNDAFSHLPWPSIDMLMRELDRTRMILRAHVVPGERRYLSDIPDGERLSALQNGIYIWRDRDKTYVINNNLWAEVVTPDLPAINGRVHIINRLLYVPYHSVYDLLTSRDELRPFHDLMSACPDYMTTVRADDKNVTLFVPSARYLRTVTSQQLFMMRSNPSILKRLYYGHILPQVRMDDAFLRQYPEENYIVSKSSYNVSFTITRTDGGVFVDGGYDLQILNVINRAYGCTNGVIYIIDGFLNFSPLTILERLRREPSVSRSLEHMLQLPPLRDAELLNNHNMTFTFLMPDDLAVDFLTFADISYLHNLRHTDRQMVFWRHVLNGSEVTYEELRDGHVDPAILPPGVSFAKSGTGLYFRYGAVNSRVTRWNLVACNGVIHLLTHYLYVPPTSTTPASQSGTSRFDHVQGLANQTDHVLGSTNSSSSFKAVLSWLWAMGLVLVVVCERIV